MHRFYQKLILIMAICLGSIGLAGWSHSNSVSAKPVYDLSEWQLQINNRQAKKLKHEVDFVILRVQYGSSYSDRVFKHNAKIMDQHHIPYGVYSYSLYTSKKTAKKEARALYRRAPKAKFYANDFEENHVKHGSANAATKAWANEIHHLTHRPAILYSGLYFINQHVGNAKKAYNAIWLASYSRAKPNTHFKYDLWQYTSNHHSRSLKENVDASILSSNKPLSFWTGKKGHHTIDVN